VLTFAIYVYVCISIYGSTALCWTLVSFTVSWSFYTVGRDSLDEWSARRKVSAYTQDNKNVE
jgi:hypothetical protein